jgi:hypothetical protein
MEYSICHIALQQVRSGRACLISVSKLNSISEMASATNLPEEMPAEELATVLALVGDDPEDQYVLRVCCSTASLKQLCCLVAYFVHCVHV